MPTPDEPSEGAPSSAMATTGQAVVAGASEGLGQGFRDREPPPSYDGESPESTFTLWERNVRLWEYETDVPRSKRGVKLLRVLTGMARVAVEEMPFEEIACEDGLRNVMGRLKDFFQPHLEVSLPRAFENAVYGQPRTSKEGFGEYIARMDRGFNRLAKEGVSLPESAQGYIVYRQAGLSEAQDQRFLVWSDGKYDRSSVVKALRKLDKVVKERGKGNYLMDASENDLGIFSAEGDGAWEIEDDDDENYVYVQEGDLGEVMDEEDVLHALASYREIRQAMKDQRKGRGFYGKGLGAKGKSKGSGKWQKVHTEQLKMRSRCWKCGQVGHWSKECSADARARTNQSSSASGAGVSSSVSTAKSGFLVVSGRPDDQEGHSAFWLREFVAEAAKTRAQQSERAYKSETGFSGIATFPEHGVVDTAAEGGLIGKPALERLQQKLHSHGIRVKWIPKTSTAKGVGGNATCVGVVLIPIGIAGVNGILETTVVDGDVPLLLPVRMLTGLKAVINLESMSLHLRAYDVEVPLHELPSGHVTVDIMDFDNGKFSMPMDVPGCIPEDFHVFLSRDECGSSSVKSAAAMAQRQTASRNSIPKFTYLAPADHGGAGVAFEKNGEVRECSSQSRCADGCPATGAPSQACLERMACGVGQNLRVARFHRAPKPRGRVVSTVAALAWLTLGTQGGDAGRCLCSDDPWGEDAYAFEVQGGGQSLHQQLCSPSRQSEGRGECLPVLHSVQGLPCTLGEHIDHQRHQEVHEGKQGIQDKGPLESKGGDPISDGHLRVAGGHSHDARFHGVKHGHGAGGDEAADHGVAECASTRAAENPRGGKGDDGGVQQSTEESPSNVDTRGGADGSLATSAQGFSQEPGDTAGLRGADGQRGLRAGSSSAGEPCDRLGGGRWSPLKAAEEEGEWCEATTTQARRALRKIQGATFRGVPGVLRASMEYEHLVGDMWQKVEGMVPLRDYGTVRVWLTQSNKTRLENMNDSTKEKHFSNKDRKRVNRSVQHVLASYEEKVVSEVFSPPRVAEMAGRKGLRQGTSFDLATGWDLSQPSQRQKMWQKLRSEQPELVVICPPCKMFSLLQELNYANMPVEEAMMLIQIGLDDLETAALVAEWQVKRGKYYVFEHPDRARSWHEACLQRLSSWPGTFRTRCDMCAYGLAVDGEGFNLKPTGILTNSRYIAKRMSRRCPGDHQHAPLMGGRAVKAQVYTKTFCEEIIKGIKEQVVADGGWARDEKLVYVTEGDEAEVEAYALEDEGLMDEEAEEQMAPEGQGLEEAVGEGGGSEAVSPQDQAAVLKLHKGVGHPALPDFLRFMKAARIRGEVVRWASKHFKCETCEAKPRTKTVRPATIPKTYQPGKVLGVDLFYIPGVGGQQLVPVLSMLDWGSNYHMVELISNKEPSTVWNTLWGCWARTFGLPEVLVCDAGKEFAAEFIKTATANGVVVYPVGARAPWQNGKTERHGHHFKELLEKARTEMVVTQEDELRRLMQEVESIKNRYSNRSGFSPVQRQIGQWPRTPADITSDEVIDPSLVAGALVDDVERLWEMRRVAQKAFVEHNAKEAVGKALRGRARTSVEFQPGDFVYIYRVHRQRKRRLGIALDVDYAKNKPTWVGPGTVVCPDGANLWVTVWGELWKVAKEQCRLATNLEKHGVELVMKECKDLVEEYKKTSKRAGYKDLTGEPFPEDSLEDEEQPQEEDKRRVRFSEEHEEEAYSPSIGPDPPEEPHQHQADQAPPSHRSHTSGATREEPEAEGLEEPSMEDSTEENSEIPEDTAQANTLPSLTPTEQQRQDPDFMRIAQASAASADRLDGIPAAARTGWRVRAENRSQPYLTEVFWLSEEDAEEYELEQSRERFESLMKHNTGRSRGDYWTVNRQAGTITKHHTRRRKALYSPKHDSNLPVALSDLKPVRKTHMKFLENRPASQVEDTWDDHGKVTTNHSWWTGTTTFEVKTKASQEEVEAMSVLAVEKRRSDDVDMRRESPKDLEEWKVADLEEWKKMTSTPAVRVLDVEESRKVRNSLKKEGKLDRILPTKIARRYKPAEQPGEPAVKKSRLCIRGDLDPDILSLERFAPTVNTMNLAVMFQIAANENMLAQIGDLKNAFCQSQKLERKGGKLYFRLPPEGVEGVDDEQLVEIIAGCYGLVDAPAHWRRSLTDYLKVLGYVQSSLDPCLFKLYSQGRLQGMVAIEIDDLFMVGHQPHLDKIKQLQERFVFGKFVTLKETPQGGCFQWS